MNYSTISIAIATFNSEKTLSKTLESIKKQNYPQKKIEILVIDGGSTDQTLTLAIKYVCKIIPNPKTELIFAKHIGFLKASGQYLMYLDSDEVLENPESLKVKYLAFKKNNQVKSVMPSGYEAPIDAPSINHYINEFGDPFSFFIYRESKGGNYLIKDWSFKYKKIHEDENMIVFSFFETSPLPLIDLFAGGCMIDLQYAKNSFPQIKSTPFLIAHLFYLLNTKNTLLAITKKDNTIHYSSQNLNQYLRKIASRVKNNIYQTDMGKSGFVGREHYQPFWFRLKKYLFIPYSLSLIFPLVDSVYLTATRKKIIYFCHVLLCIHTSLLIIYYYSLKLLGIKPKIKNYGS